jgi:hypothetical protein
MNTETKQLREDILESMIEFNPDEIDDLKIPEWSDYDSNFKEPDNSNDTFIQSSKILNLTKIEVWFNYLIIIFFLIN